MHTKTIRIISLITLLSLFSLSCNLLSLALNKSGNQSSSSEETPAAGKQSGETGSEDYIYDEGGFQFTPVSDWKVNCAIGIIQMAAPDASDEFGPAFLIMAGENPDEMTNEEAFEKLKEQSTAAKIGKPKKMKVDGVSALQAELTSTQGDIEIQSIVVTAMITPTRQFSFLAMAPMDRWKGEIEPYYQDLLKSIKFFDPVAGATCPDEVGFTDLPNPPEVNETPPELVETGELLHQWAMYATASSEYSSDSWSAMQATGAPDVNECTDSSDAWASMDADSEEWLELTYATPVIPTEIIVHMNYNPSQITEIQIIDVNYDAYTVLETEPVNVDYCPDVYQISIELDKEVYITGIKIFIDQSQLGTGWNEIDAVELIGIPSGATAAEIPQSSAPGTSSNSSSISPYQPNELDPGAYTYDISGYENDVVMGANVQYQSTDNGYVVGLISGTERYIISLFIPKEGIHAGLIQMAPYDQTSAAKGLTAAIYINAFLYIAQDGEYDFQTDPSSGIITATFRFSAQSKDFPDRTVEIAGAVNKVPLK